MNNSLLNIGDLVTLQSHAYTGQLTSIVISGDHTSLPPIMIVAEINKIIDDKGNDKKEYFFVKCIYFSSKSNLVQEVKLRNDFLKKISYKKKKEDDAIQAGSMVVLKSTRIELKKRKSTFSLQVSVNSVSKQSISALLSFLPPVFHVKEVKPFMRKKESKNFNQDNFWQSQSVAKCFYYNSHSDRMTEIELPIDCIEILIPMKEEVLNTINGAIKSKEYLQCKDDKINLIIKPSLISFRCGFYFLNGFSIIDGINHDIMLTDKMEFTVIKDIISYKAPTSSLPNFAAETILADIIAKINLGIAEEKYLHIKYRNQNDQVTLRTLSKYRLQEDTVNNTWYLIGHCHLRKEERIFNVKKIQMVQVLAVDYA